ncbi:MAG: hypothetical protein VCB79_04085, partial [Dehalococcoidia bacterium]
WPNGLAISGLSPGDRNASPRVAGIPPSIVTSDMLGLAQHLSIDTLQNRYYVGTRHARLEAEGFVRRLDVSGH